MNTDHESALINTLATHGITIGSEDVPQVLKQGIDNILSKHGVELPSEEVTTLHLILFELRN
jgi:hypothetical protein